MSAIDAACRIFPVAMVQNRYNLVDRGSENVLAYCAANNRCKFPTWKKTWRRQGYH
jgi:aryl-alcohol dehydrogenase-like predicted oxidoreductase